MDVYKTSWSNQPSVNISILNSSNGHSGANFSPPLDRSSVDQPLPDHKLHTSGIHSIGGSDLSKKNKSIITASNASLKSRKPSENVEKSNPLLVALQTTINALYKKVQ